MVRRGLDEGFVSGLDAEAHAFGELVVSGEATELMGLFFARRAADKDRGIDATDVLAPMVRKVAVLGGGQMGAGIAYVTTAVAGLRARIKDKDNAAVLRGLGAVHRMVHQRVARKRITRAEADRLMHTVTGTVDYSGFRDADIVIEAVFEDLTLKQRVLREVEEVTRPDAIFASNTSALPIGRIAEASLHPETVVGMHYFSPVHRMPLLEVVVTDRTAPWVTATAVALGKRQGKTVIVVRDGVGFYTTRILAAFMNEAAHLLTEGGPVDRIDAALVDFGFPVGPLELTDEVGIDVAANVGEIMRRAYGDRMAAPETFGRLIAAGRLGRKGRRGFYLYDGKKKGVDPTVYAVLDVKPSHTAMDDEDIAERCVLRMVDEAARCYGEGILRSARDGDLGAVLGLGFPPFRGGPFRYVDATGVTEIVMRLERYRDALGHRFEPAPLLSDMARTGAVFHGETVPRPAAPRAQPTA